MFFPVEIIFVHLHMRVCLQITCVPHRTPNSNRLSSFSLWKLPHSMVFCPFSEKSHVFRLTRTTPVETPARRVFSSWGLRINMCGDDDVVGIPRRNTFGFEISKMDNLLVVSMGDSMLKFLWGILCYSMLIVSFSTGSVLVTYVTARRHSKVTVND